MNKEVLKEYAEIKKQLDEISEKESELKERVISELEADNIKTADTNLGKFTVSEYKKYSFSEEFTEKIKPIELKIKKDNEKIKKAEQEEIESGKAEVSITRSLRFTPQNNG